MLGEKIKFRDLRMHEYDIAGNVFRAWYDDDGLAFVVDETIDEYKPNVLLVVRPRDSRKWDDLLQNVYNIDLELIRPKKDNKYQKLDIEYSGIDIYDRLIREYENHDDLKGALADLMDFRDAAVRRAAVIRLNAAQEEIDLANATARKAQNTIKSLGDRVRNLQARLAKQKERIGREPAKQSASRILRTESQIESAEEKISRAEKRLENAHRRIDSAAEEVKMIQDLLALRRPQLRESVSTKPKVMGARAKKSEVAKMPVTDEDVDGENQEFKEPKVSEMSDDSKEVKPLLDKDPEIMDEDIAFKPVSFDDLRSPYGEEPARPISPYAADDTEPKPEVVDDDGDRNERPFGFPGMNENTDNTETTEENKVDDDYNAEHKFDSDVIKADDDSGQESSEYKPEFYSPEDSSEPKESKAEEDTAIGGGEQSMSEFESNFMHDDFSSHKYDYSDEKQTAVEEEPVIDTIKSVEEPVSADVDDGGQVSSTQPENIGVDTPKHPFAPVEVPRMPVNDTRPMSPINANSKPRPVGGKRSSFAYYILLILLIALSIFTLWLYQKKHGGTVPFLGLGERTEQTVVDEPIVEPDVPVVLPVPQEPDEPVVLPTPVVEPAPVVAPAPVAPVLVDKPIEVRFPNNDILRGPEPEVPVVESEEDVLARKAPYGVSRDDKPVLVEVQEPVIETVIETVVEEPVINVTTVSAPDVIFEEDVVCSNADNG